MPIYLAVVERTRTGFGASFPDVPGCTSAAASIEHLPAMCLEALEGHLSDQEAPTPSPFEKVLAEAREYLAEGAFLLAVPWERATA